MQKKSNRFTTLRRRGNVCDCRTTNDDRKAYNEEVFKLPIINIEPYLNRTEEDYAATTKEKLSQLQAQQASVAKQWDTAFCNVGFVIIEGHDVPPTLIQSLRQKAKEIFELSSHETKMKYRRGPYGSPLGGYNPIGRESVRLSRDTMGSDGGNSNAGDEADFTVVPSSASADSDSPAPDLVESFILKPSQIQNDPSELATLGVA